MSREKGGPWREEDLRLLRDYFNQGIEVETKEHIRKLTLAKLEQLPLDVDQGNAEKSMSGWAKSILRWSRSVWWRWQWKAVLPLILMFIIAGAGYQWNHHIIYSLQPTSHSKQSESQGAASGSVFSANIMSSESTSKPGEGAPKSEESAPKSAYDQDSAAVMKGMTANNVPQTAPQLGPKEPQDTPPTASADALSRKPKSLFPFVVLTAILAAGVGGGIWIFKKANKGTGKKPPG